MGVISKAHIVDGEGGGGSMGVGNDSRPMQWGIVGMGDSKAHH